MSPTKRALDEPEDNLVNKRPRSRSLYASLEGGEDDAYGDAEPPGPMRTNPHIAQQAQATTAPSGLDSQQRRHEATSLISAPSFVGEGSTARAADECSTLGWNKITNMRSESVTGIGKITKCFDGSVESLHSTHTLINQTRVGTSEVRISRPIPERGDRELASGKGLKSKGKEREACANTNSTHPTTDYEDAPAPPVARSLNHRDQQNVPHANTWYGPHTVEAGGSLLSESTSYPLWGLDDDELDASLERLDEYFTANPHLVLTPADVASLPTSFSSTFGAAQAPPHQHNGTAEMTGGYLQSVHLNTPSPLSSLSSPSPSGMSSSSSVSVWNHPDPSFASSLSSALPMSRSYPVHRSSAPMGTVSEATVLWLVCNVPLAQISSMLPRVLSLPEPETELSVLVLRECRGRHRVTAAEVNDFETMVYNESVDERWRGRRHRQRRPRRRSHL